VKHIFEGIANQNGVRVERGKPAKGTRAIKATSQAEAGVTGSAEGTAGKKGERIIERSPTKRRRHPQTLGDLLKGLEIALTDPWIVVLGILRARKELPRLQFLVEFNTIPGTDRRTLRHWLLRIRTVSITRLTRCDVS
jgi:hypothetical protein